MKKLQEAQKHGSVFAIRNVQKLCGRRRYVTKLNDSTHCGRQGWRELTLTCAIAVASRKPIRQPRDLVPCR